MLKKIACATLLGAALSPAAAQDRCVAADAEALPNSPHLLLRALEDSTRMDGPFTRHGAACSMAAGDRDAAATVTIAGIPLTGRVLLPTARIDVAGGLPRPDGTGSAWAGRGTTVFVRLGLAVDAGPFHAVLAPEAWTAENRGFDLFPSRDTARSSFASPWYGAPWSIDLPSRFGTDRLTRLEMGQSAAWVTAGPVEAGVATSSQHWGPGRRGGLVLSGDAPGVPRVFARAMPVATPVGLWSGEAFTGVLTESRFFDRDPLNDHRTLTGATLGWRPNASAPIRVGVAHASMRQGARVGGGPPPHGASDQLNSIFLEVGGVGTRAYTEIARAGALPSLGRFLRMPYAGVAYLVGAEHAIRLAPGALLVQAEFANLEQQTDVRGDSTFDFYTSRRIPQGWTQRGQLLGHGGGPGSNRGTVALTWVASRWSVGVFGDRTRWNDDALHREFLANVLRHDVSLRAGLRGTYVAWNQELSLELSTGKRLNYLFQNDEYMPYARTVDMSIPQLRIAISPLRVAY